MEVLIIIYSATLRENLEKLFKKLEIDNYTLLPEVLGAGKGGSVRLNTEVWPGINQMYLVQTDTVKSELLKDWVREYRRKKVREGLKLFSITLNEVI